MIKIVGVFYGERKVSSYSRINAMLGFKMFPNFQVKIQVSTVRLHNMIITVSHGNIPHQRSI